MAGGGATADAVSSAKSCIVLPSVATMRASVSYVACKWPFSMREMVTRSTPADRGLPLESLRPLPLARQQQEDCVDDLFATLERRWDLGDLLLE